ncbi:MAG TPA: cytochrome P450 [Actinospica sp.]|nr:cytochrome P450 [Actinospica sp.]
MDRQLPAPDADPFAAAPLPGAWPVLGHAPALLRDPLSLLASAVRLGPVAIARLGPVRAYLVTDPDLIRAILVRDAADYDKGFQFDTLRSLIGDGVGTSGGAAHRRNKSLVRSAFDHSAVERYATAMAAQTADHLDARWDPAADGVTVLDAAAEMRTLAMRLVAHSMSGSEVDADEVTASLPELLSGAGRRALLPIRTLERLPTPGNRRFEQSLAAVHAVADGMVARHRGRAASGDAQEPPTLLSILLSAVDEDGDGLTDAQAHDEIMTLLLAGTETVAGVLAWALHLLAEDPGLQQRIREEVLEVTGGRAPTVAEMRRLDLTERFAKEILRLYPPGWILGRRPLRDVRLHDTLVPARSQVLLNFYGLHRDPAAFADPDRFDPDRWIDADPELVGSHYLPFGMGPRGCLGEGYAWTEIYGVLCAVVTRYRLESVPGSRVRAVARTTLHPDTVPLRLTRCGPAADPPPTRYEAETL